MIIYCLLHSIIFTSVIIGQNVIVLYSMGIAALSIALTVTGIAAALWHLGQWIALVLVSSVVLSAALVTIAIAQGLPPQSAGDCVTTGTFQLAGSPTQPHGVGCSAIPF